MSFRSLLASVCLMFASLMLWDQYGDHNGLLNYRALLSDLANGVAPSPSVTSRQPASAIKPNKNESHVNYRLLHTAGQIFQKVSHNGSDVAAIDNADGELSEKDKTPCLKLLEQIQNQGLPFFFKQVRWRAYPTELSKLKSVAHLQNCFFTDSVHGQGQIEIEIFNSDFENQHGRDLKIQASLFDDKENKIAEIGLNFTVSPEGVVEAIKLAP